MNNNMLFDALKKLTQEESKEKKPMNIYQDENGQIKEIPLSDSAAATINKNPAKSIRNFMFGF